MFLKMVSMFFNVSKTIPQSSKLASSLYTREPDYKPHPKLAQTTSFKRVSNNILQTHFKQHVSNNIFLNINRNIF